MATYEVVVELTTQAMTYCDHTESFEVEAESEAEAMRKAEIMAVSDASHDVFDATVEAFEVNVQEVSAENLSGGLEEERCTQTPDMFGGPAHA